MTENRSIAGSASGSGICEKKRAACAFCGREENLLAVPFYPNASREKVTTMPITPADAANVFYLHACEDCGRERGRTPGKAWLWWLIGCAMLVFGIVMASDMHAFGLENSSPVPFLLLGPGFLIVMIAGMVLVNKARFMLSNGMLGLHMCLQVFPGIGLLSLLFLYRKINRCSRALTALKPRAEEQLKVEKNREEEIMRLASSGQDLSEEDRKRVEQFRKETEEKEQVAEYERQVQEEKTNRSNFRSAVIGIIFTVIIGLIGLSTYDSGRGYMTFFGIKLSAGGFAALIAAFLIGDVISLVSAIRKKNR